MTTALLLAAGLSQRFGADDKLCALFRGKPLVRHAAEALSGYGSRIAVVSSEAVAALLTEFDVIRIDGEAAQSRSLKAGVARVHSGKLLVTLGDMPLVTPEHLQKVVDACGEGGAAASHNGTRLMPPACFDAKLFPDLLATSGDQGAGPILKRLATPVVAPPEMLVDIDTRHDLAVLDP